MPLVYPLQCLHLAFNVWMDLMQNLAKPCKLFIWCNLSDFARSRCPVLHIALIFRVLPLFEGSISSLLEGERTAWRRAEASEYAPQPQSSCSRNPSHEPRNCPFKFSLMEQSGLAKLRSVGGSQDSTTNARVKAGNTLKLQPFVFGRASTAPTSHFKARPPHKSAFLSRFGMVSNRLHVTIQASQSRACFPQGLRPSGV
jgi:hypothetical protein